MTRLINFCWFWFKWGLIACVIGAALLVPYFYHRMDGEIRRRVETLFAKQYPGLQIKLRSAVLMKGEGIELRGLAVLDPAAEGPGAELLTYDECFLACSTDLADLMGGEPRPTRIVLRRPVLRMTRRPDGSWSAAKLLPLPRFGKDASPEVRVENGTIEVFDPTRVPACSFTLRDVNFTFAPVPPEHGQIERTRRRRVQGTATGDYFRQVSFDGEIDIDRPALNLVGQLEGLEVSPEMRDTLPDLLGCNLSFLGSLRGDTEVRFHVAYDPAAQQRWSYAVDGKLSRGRLDDSRLPHPLTEVQAAVHLDNAGFSIRDFKARSNQATLALSVAGRFGGAGPMDIEGEIHQLPLDEALLSILSPACQQHWRELQPEGLIDASLQLHYDGRRWQPRASVKCQNVSFAYAAFPYRLERGNGRIDIEDDRLAVDLTADSENHAVRLTAEVRDPFLAPTGWLRINCDALPLDEKLLRALPPPAQALARSLDLKGSTAVAMEVSREAAGAPVHQDLRLSPSRCALRYDRFPFALSNVGGELEMYDGNWRVQHLEGYNGTSRVTCEGTFAATPQGNDLVLHLAAGNVPLEGELRDALPSGMRQVWALLQPHGIIDLSSTIHFLGGPNVLDVAVRAEPRSDTCSLEPVHFPYRLENVQGTFTYGGGAVTFERVSCWHGAVKLACNGNCSFQPDGSWQLRLDRMSVDRLRLDRQFMQILPPQLKKSLGELNATGPISLQGSVIVARPANQAVPTVSQWNLSLGLNQVGLDCGVRLENIYGTSTVSGWSDGTHYQVRGELALESLTCRDLQFTQVLGPFWLDDQKAMFGSWVARQDNQTLPRGQPQAALRPLVAKIFGGTIYGDGWAALGEQPRYNLAAAAVDLDLAACDRELSGKNRNLHGRLQGKAELHGMGRNRAAMNGNGELHLVDANIYELPAMVSLLKIVNLRAPDPNAFSKSDAYFKIEGEHVNFEKLDFNGDAISLSGKGEVSFQGDTRMVFTATLGRGDSGVPLLHNLFTGVSQQIMQIRVNGNLQNPDIHREAFPGANAALKELQR